MGASAAEKEHADRARAAVDLLDAHGAVLRRVARRHSLGPEDADDALQRAAEILLTKAPSVEPNRLIAWMAVVTKHEALAVRRSRERLLTCLAPAGPPDRPPPDPFETIAAEAPGPAERARSAASGWRPPATRSPSSRPTSGWRSCSRPRATPTRRSASAAGGPTRRSTAASPRGGRRLRGAVDAAPCRRRQARQRPATCPRCDRCVLRRLRRLLHAPTRSAS